MATANFWNQTRDGYPLYAIPTFYPTDEEYEREIADCEDDECISPIDLAYLNSEDAYGYLPEIIKEHTMRLVYHTITLKPGYYDGVQLFVESEFEDDYIQDITPYDAKYDFDAPPSVVKRRWEADKKRTLKALKAIAKQAGMKQLRCVGVFSSGEALYEEVKD